MSLLTIIWSMLSAACLVIGQMHALVWWHDRTRRLNLVVAVMAVAAGANAMVELGLMKSASIDGFITLAFLGNLTIAVTLVSMVWVVHLMLGTARRSLLLIITGLWSFLSVVNLVSPASLTYASVDALLPLTTFWGEDFVLAVGPANRFKFLADLVTVLIIIYTADATWRAWHQRRHRQAAIVGGSILGFIVLAGIHTPLVDAGIVKTPFMISIAFIGIVVTLSHQMAHDAALALRFAREMEAGRRRWESLLDSVHLAVLEVDADGLLRYANPFFCRTTGYLATAIVGRPLGDLVSAEQRNELLLRLVASSGPEGPRPHGRWKVTTKTGKLLTFDWSTVPLLTPDNEYDGLLTIGADVTKELEAKASLELARQAIDRKARANILGEFATALAHELNQPLGAVLANARTVQRYLASDPPRHAQAAEVMELIVRDDKRAATILQRLRAMVTRGQVVHESFDIRGPVNEVLEICEAELHARGIVLRRDLGDESLPVVAGLVDIQQVMLNLVRNAMQALTSGHVSDPVICVSCIRDGDDVRVDVVDNGPGIALGGELKIFEAGHGSQEQGLGMGLAICQRIIEAHGGRIQAMPETRGARLSFKLPICFEDAVQTDAI